MKTVSARAGFPVAGSEATSPRRDPAATRARRAMSKASIAAPTEQEFQSSSVFDELGMERDPNNLYLQIIDAVLQAADILELPTTSS